LEPEPLLQPHQVLLFAGDNSETFERELIDKLAIRQVGLAEVVADSGAVAQHAIDGWAKQFGQTRGACRYRRPRLCRHTARREHKAILWTDA
jgi:hypothetical protein